MVSRNRWTLIAVVCSVTVLLTGCFNFGPKAPTVPTPVNTKVSGVIEAPQGTPGLASSRQPAHSGVLAWLRPTARAELLIATVPVPDATVVAYEVPSLKVISSTGKTDSQGRYTLTGLPSGKSIIVVATKEVSGGDAIRMSTYVPSVGTSTEANVDPATSLATEAVTQRIRDSQNDFADSANWEDLWNSARFAANQAISRLSADGDEESIGNLLVVGRGAIQEGEIGSGLHEDYDEVLALPVDPVSDEALARIMIQTWRDAGYSMKDTLELRLASHQESITEHVIPHLQELGQVVSRSMDVFHLVDREPDGGEFDYIEYGSVEQVRDGSKTNGSWIVHVYESEWDWAYGGTKGDYIDTYTITRLSDNHYKLTAKHVEHDLTTEYNAGAAFGEARMHRVNGKIFLDTETVTFSDVVLSTTFRQVQHPRGTGSTFVVEKQAYHGNIRSDLFDLRGAMTFLNANNVHYCNDWSDPYDEPWSGYVSCHAPIAFIEIDGVLELPTLKIDGTFLVTLEYEHSGLLSESPQEVEGYVHIRGSLQERGVLTPARMTGDMELTFEYASDAGASSVDPWPIDAEIVFRGLVEMPGHAPITLDITAVPEEQDRLSSEIEYRRGDNILKGTAEIKLGDLFEVDLSLVNENDIQLELSYVEGGSRAHGFIRKVGSAKGDHLATISVGGPSVIEVLYTSGYFESLF